MRRRRLHTGGRNQEIGYHVDYFRSQGFSLQLLPTGGLHVSLVWTLDDPDISVDVHWVGHHHHRLHHLHRLLPRPCLLHLHLHLQTHILPLHERLGCCDRSWRW